MNILVVSQYFYPETFRINTLCKELVKRGHTVTVMTGYPQYPQGKIYDGYGFNIPYDIEWNGVNICRLKVHPRGKTIFGQIRNCLDFVIKGNRYVKKCDIKYDVVYIFEVSPVTVGLPAVRYGKKFNVPLVLNVQDLWPESVEIVLGIHNPIIINVINRIVDKIYNASAKILCSSRGFVENIAQRNVSKDKLEFWPQFCEKPNLLEAKRPLEYSNEYFNVVFAGNVGYAQGLDLLVECAKELRDTKIRWYIVGDGRAFETLKEKIVQYQLEDRIFLLGRKSEYEANVYIKFADFAYLSLQNNKLLGMTIPAKLQSYLSCGTPVFAAVEGESRKIVEENKCGIGANPTIEECVSAFREILSLSNDDIKKMKDNAVKTNDKYFDIDMLIDKLETIFHEVTCIEDGKE